MYNLAGFTFAHARAPYLKVKANDYSDLTIANAFSKAVSVPFQKPFESCALGLSIYTEDANRSERVETLIIGTLSLVFAL